jgi:hypothetical protein
MKGDFREEDDLEMDCSGLPSSCLPDRRPWAAIAPASSSSCCSEREMRRVWCVVRLRWKCVLQTRHCYKRREERVLVAGQDWGLENLFQMWGATRADEGICGPSRSLPCGGYGEIRGPLSSWGCILTFPWLRFFRLQAGLWTAHTGAIWSTATITWEIWDPMVVLMSLSCITMWIREEFLGLNHEISSLTKILWQ